MSDALKEFGIKTKDLYLVFDISNLLYRSFYGNKENDDMTTAGLAHHQALTTLNKYYKQYHPTKVVMTFDKSNWRKIYTMSDDCYSKKIYKGHRRQNMTPAEQEKYARFCNHLVEFQKLMHEYTSVICLWSEGEDKRGLEADDLISGVVNKFKDTADIVIISSDQDLMQLLRHKNVKLIDPASDKERSLAEYNDDPDYFLFFKCIRGDSGDNVASAYPRVRATKIEAAYKDPYERENMLNTKWTNENGEERVVRKMYEENRLLMDLSCQPDDIKQLIETTVNEGFENIVKYSHFHFLRFCGKYELKNVSEKVEQYLPMLSS